LFQRVYQKERKTVASLLPIPSQTGIIYIATKSIQREKSGYVFAVHSFWERQFIHLSKEYVKREIMMHNYDASLLQILTKTGITYIAQRICKERKGVLSLLHIL